LYVLAYVDWIIYAYSMVPGKSLDMINRTPNRHRWTSRIY